MDRGFLRELKTNENKRRINMNVTKINGHKSRFSETEQLIRDSERLAIARAYVKDTRYPDKDMLMAILGIEKDESKGE
jgi:hypothetical protein